MEIKDGHKRENRVVEKGRMGIKKPLISVIITVYNAESYLCKCVNSVESQTYENLEILLVLSGEQLDDSEKIAHALAQKDERIKLLKCQTSGVAKARNKGLMSAHGKYVGFVDSDDWIEPTMYEKLYEALFNETADISVCRFLREKGNVIQKYGEDYAGVIGTYDGIKWLISDKVTSVTWNKLFLKELFDGIQFPEINIYEDVAVMHQLFAKALRIAMIRDFEYHYIVHRGSLINQKNFTDRIVAVDVIHQRYDYVKKYFPTVCDEMLPVIFGSYVTMAASAIRWPYTMRQKQKILRGALPLMNKNNSLLEKFPRWQRCCLNLFSRNNYLADCVGLALEYIRRKVEGK